MMVRFLTAVFLVWVAILTIKFYYFGYYDWDLALYSQVMYGLTHGSMTPSLVGANFLVDHPHYIAFLLAPLYKIFPHPLTLIYLNVACFILSAYLLYQFANRFLTPFLSAIVTLGYLFYPANVFMLLYEFHFESLSIVITMAMFLAFIDQRIGRLFFLSLLLMLCKENMAGIVFMFAAVGIFYHKNHRAAFLLLLILSLSFFYFSIFKLIPWLRQGLPTTTHMYFSLYGKLGDGPGGMLSTLLHHPQVFIDQIFSPLNQRYMVQVFIPWLMAAVFNPWPLLVASPILLQNMLSGAHTQHTVFFHYTSSLAPCLFIGVVLGLNQLRYIRPFYFKLFLSVIVSIFVVQWLGYKQDLMRRTSGWVDARDPERQKLIEMIPKDASVVTSFDFLSHMTERKRLYAFYLVWRGANYFTGDFNYKIPSDIEYALIDFDDPWLREDRALMKEATEKNLDNFFNLGWVPLKQVGHIVLYKRRFNNGQ